MSKPYFLPDKYSMSVKIDKLEKQLAKANERVEELEQINLELAANVESCCELTDMDMGAAIERLFEINNTESKALLNKFAIEKKIEELVEFKEQLGCFDNREANLIANAVNRRIEQLRKEQDSE